MILASDPELVGMIKLADPKQGRLFSMRSRFIDAVGRDSFYGMLALQCDEILADAVFKELYCQDNGRPCKSPGLLFRMLLLQIYDGCSDHKAIERAKFDLRWKVSLDLDLEEHPCVKSTFQEFRARIHLSEKGEQIFKSTLDEAKKVGLLKGSKLKVALDTTPVLGRGAVKDTYNLLADGIRKVAQVLAGFDGTTPEEWGAKRDISRFWEGSSLKGDANIDWSNDHERRIFLTRLVADAQMVLLEADRRIENLSKDQAAPITEASSLLRRLISQDTEPVPPPPSKGAPKAKGDPEPQQPATATAGPEHCAATATEGSNSLPSSSEQPTIDAELVDISLSNAADSVDPPSQESQLPTIVASAPESHSEQPAVTIDDAPETTPEPPNEPESNSNSRAEATTPAERVEEGLQQPTREALPAEPGQIAVPETDHVIGQMLRLTQGVAPDRVISVSDPEMRHGRKSASKRFDGHKLSVCVDVDSGLFLSMDVIGGNAPDNQDALGLVRKAEANAGIKVERALGDCAYGDGATRKQFKEANIELSAKVPSPPANDPYHKSRFTLDLTNRIATCPAGKESGGYDYVSKKTGDESVPVPRFHFPGEVCGVCPHRDQCVKSPDKNQGRTVTLHPQEDLLQEARARQSLPEFREDIKDRQVVEHRLARAVQVGGRQSRYFGRAKTKLQYMLALIVGNLTRIGSFFVRLWGLLVAILVGRSPNCGKPPHMSHLSTKKTA